MRVPNKDILMHTTFAKPLFLLLLSLFAIAGCVRQSGHAPAAKLEMLPGVYRVVWSNGEAHDHNFNVENKNGGWYMLDGTEAVPMRQMAVTEIEEIFGKDVAGSSQCLETGAASTIIICVTEPGVATTVRIDDIMSYHKDFTSKTGYFVYIDYLGIWDLEKLK